MLLLKLYKKALFSKKKDFCLKKSSTTKIKTIQTEYIAIVRPNYKTS